MFKLPKNIDLKEALVNFPGHLHVKDLKGYYCGANIPYVKFLRLKSVEDLLGKKDKDFFPKDLAKLILEKDRKVIKEGGCLTFEETLINSKGEKVIFLSMKSPLFDSKDNLIGVACNSLEITSIIKNQRQFEKHILHFNKVRDKNLYMDNILWRLPEQFYWMDLNGRVIACNENQAAAFGMKRNEFIGKNIFDLAKDMNWDEDIAIKIHKNDKEVIETGKAIVTEENFQLHGVSKTYLSYKNPLYDFNNKLIGIFGVSIDITDRKNMENDLIEQKIKAEAANVVKTSFLMNMSHDIRTPFTGIIGNADLLLHKETSKEKKRMLKEIIQSSQYLLDLLNDVIEVAKLDDQSPIENHSFDLLHSLDKIVTLIKPQATQKLLYLNVNISNRVPQYIISSQKSIERILLNLLSNAIKFTDYGGVTLDVSVKPSQFNQPILDISVKDTGIGIPKDQLDKIFEKFYRILPAYQENYQGSGLGLWIVRELLEKINGKITVKSQPARGTTFSLEMNYEDSKGMNLNISKDLHKSTLHHIKNILVVEDDPIARKVAEDLLEDFFQAHVDCATSGTRAIEMLKSGRYDFILMDIGLPDISGFEVAEILQKSLSTQHTPPIIGLSAHACETLDKKTIKVVLNKPLNYELCNTIMEIIQRIPPK